MAATVPHVSRRFLTEEEKANAPKVTKALLLRIFSYLKPYGLQFAAVFAAIVVAAIVGLFPSIITGRIVDEALVGEDMGYLVQLLLIALATMIASQLMGVLENYINAWIAQHIIYDMRNQMYRHLQDMPHSFYTTEKQGDIITRMDTDISGVSTVISGTLSRVVSNTAIIITTLVALLAMSWQLAIVGLAVLPLLILPTRSAGRSRLKYATRTQEKTDEMNQVINETLSASGSLLVKMFTREKLEFQKFEHANAAVTKLSMKETRSGSLFSVAMGMFTQLGPLLIYFFGGMLIIEHLDPTLTVGTITAMVSLINRLYRPVESMLNLQVNFTRSLALFVRIFDYLDRENPIVSPENGQKPNVERQPIRYEHVSFGYEPDHPILLDVNFQVPGGKMYAIVGPSGSGKSTIVNLIPRLYDVDGGSVTVAGVDVREFDLEYLRQQIGVVTQEAYLFNGTIRENLLYAREDATDEELVAACKVANIHDFIVAQPLGYDAQVGNRGLKLSGGEKQRLSLARVILKDPKILILDEATSALDSISEFAIQQALEQLMQERTSIVIAHRLSTILKADSILVVKDGQIVEQGTHEELLAQEGVYRELFDTQFSQAFSRSAAAGIGIGDGGVSAPSSDTAELDVRTLGTDYNVRRLNKNDIGDVFSLMRSNHLFYRSIGVRPSRTQLTEMITRIPEGIKPSDKHFVGFYDDDNGLIAIMDLITSYPHADKAYINWFMVDAELQNRGIGSQIIADVRAAMRAQGHIRLVVSCPQKSEGGLTFWLAQGFNLTGRENTEGEYPIVYLARDI